MKGLLLRGVGGLALAVAAFFVAVPSALAYPLGYTGLEVYEYNWETQQDDVAVVVSLKYDLGEANRILEAWYAYESLCYPTGYEGPDCGGADATYGRLELELPIISGKMWIMGSLVANTASSFSYYLAYDYEFGGAGSYSGNPITDSALIDFAFYGGSALGDAFFAGRFDDVDFGCGWSLPNGASSEFCGGGFDTAYVSGPSGLAVAMAGLFGLLAMRRRWPRRS